MSIETVYLVVNGDGEMKLRKRAKLFRGEVAFRLRVNFPDSWGKVIGDLDITVPSNTPDQLTYDEVAVEMGEDEGEDEEGPDDDGTIAMDPNRD